jgi:hypothetical protein
MVLGLEENGYVLEVIKEDKQTNLADLFPKVLPSECRRELLGSILYNI